MTDYWETCWCREDPESLWDYLDGYHFLKTKEIEIFEEHGIRRVCDAACGFGGYTLAFASNGFETYGFDVSETAVRIAREGLSRYGMNPDNICVADIRQTGYENELFDGVIAHAVLDHLDAKDAARALTELARITRKGGLIMLSFDCPQGDDYSAEHKILSDGTIQYLEGGRKGMLFSPFDWRRIEDFSVGYEIIYRAEDRREKRVILRK